MAEVDFDGGYLKNIDVKIPQPLLTDVNIKFDNPNNGGELVVNKAVAQIHSAFHYKYSFLSVDGTADIKVNKMALDVELGASTQPGTPSYELAPKLKIQKLNIDINPNDVDITLKGGLVSKIAGILIPYLKKTVIPTVINEVKTTATDLINNQVDNDLKLYGVQEEIPYLGGVTVDYA